MKKIISLTMGFFGSQAVIDPWGSSNNENTRNRTFLSMVEDLKRQGLSEPEIVKGLGLSSTTQLRALKTIANNQQKQAEISTAQRLHDKGLSNVAIGEKMGRNESSIRALLAPGAKDRADVLTATADMLRKEVADKKYVDIGSGVEYNLGISKEKLNTAAFILREEGYEVHNVPVPQVAVGKNTQIKVIAPPGTTQHEIWKNRDQIKQIKAFSEDKGRRYGQIHPPISVHPDRIDVRYKNEGGAEADGVIYVRPGVEDISLGKSRYAQVRVKVGDSHYLKGMAMYKDDLPEGVDLLFNSNKLPTGNKFDAMKKLEDDPELPFGSVVRQIMKHEGTPEEHVTSAMNIVREEGQWHDWSKALSTQFLSKQSPTLAKEQLNKTYDSRNKELKEINSLTNPTIKKKLLLSFSDGTDSAAVHLEAAALSQRQQWHAILPLSSIKEGEVYAPQFNNGERVVLLRFPHSGTFEIPDLIVNNKNSEGKRLLGDAPDAVGIHHVVAKRLSGADFDGDTVIVIPNNTGKVRTSPALDSLKNFDPQHSYPGYPGMVPIGKRKQQEMGSVSNLITDMTIKGASHGEIARAVRHSMVVIDADKHNLNWKESAIRNGIPQLKSVYQGGPRSGADTLISKATARAYINQRKPRPYPDGGPIDKVTGKKVFVDTGKTKTTPRGDVVLKKERTTKLAITDDAHTLVSGIGTPMEKTYADHSNKLKALANSARLSAINTPPLIYSPSAHKTYSKQVASLDSKLALAKMKQPLERQAQVIAQANIKAKREANPNLDGDSLKKVRFKELELARIRTGAKKAEIEIDQDEWNAIQSGAISNHKLEQILTKANLDGVRKLATPRSARLMTTDKTQRAKLMLAGGATRAEVAQALGVSLSTLDKATKES